MRPPDRIAALKRGDCGTCGARPIDPASASRCEVCLAYARGFGAGRRAQRRLMWLQYAPVSPLDDSARWREVAEIIG